MRDSSGGKEPPPFVVESIVQRGIRRYVLIDGTSWPKVAPLNDAGVDGKREVKVQPKHFPHLTFLFRLVLFTALIEYLEFQDWLILYAAGRRSVRALFDANVAPPSSLRTVVRLLPAIFII